MSEAERSPISKVVVSDAAASFIARGGRLFSGQLIDSDPGIEDGEEVIVVDRKNKPLGRVHVYH